MPRKKPDIEYCGDCNQLLITLRSGILGTIQDHWCTGLPGAFREGIESRGRHPGHWLGFLPVVCEECPRKQGGHS